MPRFVRFLPGKPPLLCFALCLPLVVSGGASHISSLILQQRRGCMFPPVQPFCICWWYIMCSQQNDGFTRRAFSCCGRSGSARYSSLKHMMVLVHYDIAVVFVMTAVPPTFLPSKNNFSPSSPNLACFKHLSASFTKAQKLPNVTFLVWSEDWELKREHDGVWKFQPDCVYLLLS